MLKAFKLFENAKYSIGDQVVYNDNVFRSKVGEIVTIIGLAPKPYDTYGYNDSGVFISTQRYVIIFDNGIRTATPERFLIDVDSDILKRRKENSEKMKDVDPYGEEIWENNLTTDFEEYKNKKVKDFNPKKGFEPLSSDIVALRELEDGNIEKIEGPIEILQVTGIITDKDRIAKLEETIIGPQFNADFGNQEVKRGSEVWITAIIKRPSNTSWNTQQNFSVLRCRVIDIYQGLNKLKTLK